MCFVPLLAPKATVAVARFGNLDNIKTDFLSSYHCCATNDHDQSKKCILNVSCRYASTLISCCQNSFPLSL